MDLQNVWAAISGSVPIGVKLAVAVVILLIAFIRFWFKMIEGWLARHDRRFDVIEGKQEKQSEEFRKLKDDNSEFKVSMVEGSMAQEKFMQATETARMKKIEMIEATLRAFRHHKHRKGGE